MLIIKVHTNEHAHWTCWKTWDCQDCRLSFSPLKRDFVHDRRMKSKDVPIARRLPKDGTSFERPEDHAYDRAYDSGGSCERLYPTCRHSIYDVDFWNCGGSDRLLIASSWTEGAQRTADYGDAYVHAAVTYVGHVANLMGNLPPPRDLSEVFLAAGPCRGDFSAWPFGVFGGCVRRPRRPSRLIFMIRISPTTGENDGLRVRPYQFIRIISPSRECGKSVSARYRLYLAKVDACSVCLLVIKITG